MSFNEYRTIRLRERVSQNVDKFHSSLLNDKLSSNDKMKVYNNFTKYYDILNHKIPTFEKYIEFLKADKINMIGLEVNPIKQSFDEECQIEYCIKILKMKLVKLPTGGKNALCFKLDNLCVCSPVGLQSNLKERTKTFDAFEPATNTYYSLKHTGEAGGAQDNQIRDVEEFLNCAEAFCNNYQADQTRFGVILSGEYMKTFANKFATKYKNNNRLNIIFLH